MGCADLMLAAVILGGALWLLYHSLWKRKGHCPGCDGGGCAGKRQ